MRLPSVNARIYSFRESWYFVNLSTLLASYISYIYSCFVFFILLQYNCFRPVLINCWHVCLNWLNCGRVLESSTMMQLQFLCPLQSAFSVSYRLLKLWQSTELLYNDASQVSISSTVTLFLSPLGQQHFGRVLDSSTMMHLHIHSGGDIRPMTYDLPLDLC